MQQLHLCVGSDPSRVESAEVPAESAQSRARVTRVDLWSFAQRGVASLMQIETAEQDPGRSAKMACKSDLGQLCRNLSGAKSPFESIMA